MRIAISGPPGSGKTTICRIVAERLGYECVLVGQIFRKMAEERGIDLETFGRLAEEDEMIDRDLDSRMVETAKSHEDIVIEGRVAGAMMRAKNVPAFTVYVDADEKVRAERIAKREAKSVESVIREMRIREASERKRYKACYGINPADRTLYDTWIDSSDMTAERIADMIVERAKEAGA